MTWFYIQILFLWYVPTERLCETLDTASKIFEVCLGNSNPYFLRRCKYVIIISTLSNSSIRICYIFINTTVLNSKMIYMSLFQRSINSNYEYNQFDKLQHNFLLSRFTIKHGIAQCYSRNKVTKIFFCGMKPLSQRNA